MIHSRRRAFIYVFPQKDARSAAERIQLAASDYCKRCGVSWEAAGLTKEALFRVVKTERGKPYFEQCPHIHLSISHSGDYWVCAMADEEIGVDLQEHVRAKGETIEGASARFRKMAQRFFHPLETAFVEMECYRNFFDVWSAREAYVKFTGQGIDREFSQHCVVPAEQELWPDLSGNTRSVSWQALGVWFTKLQYGDTYSLCFCTKNQKGYDMVDMRKVPHED